MSQPHAHLSPDAIYPFDARGVAKRFRHAAIFGALDSLQPGETMRFVNDHDPLPLLSQLAQRYGDRVGVEYRQREPGVIVIDFSVHCPGLTMWLFRGRAAPCRAIASSGWWFVSAQPTLDSHSVGRHYCHALRRIQPVPTTDLVGSAVPIGHVILRPLGRRLAAGTVTTASMNGHWTGAIAAGWMTAL